MWMENPVYDDIILEVGEETDFWKQSYGTLDCVIDIILIFIKTNPNFKTCSTFKTLLTVEL